LTQINAAEAEPVLIESCENAARPEEPKMVAVQTATGHETINLATRYLGLSLRNPVVASASPLTGELANIRHIEDAGAAAVVLPSVFEEQIEQEVQYYAHLAGVGVDGFPEVASFFPEPARYRLDPHYYLDLIRHAVDAVDIPIIASLNGTTGEGWINYARLIEEAGAKGIELNINFIPTLETTGAQVERRHLEILGALQSAVRIPIAMKLSPYFSAHGYMVTELARTGADGFVLFNRFYQPNVDLARLQVRADLKLSDPSEIRLPLFWIGMLAGRVSSSLAASTGVETAAEIAKYLLVGADVVMTTSSLLRHGIDHVRVLLHDLRSWCAAHEFHSLAQFKGTMSQQKLRSPMAFDRANYIRILQGFSKPPMRPHE
jgi:dihydroorotate dehydrogenase (fumarate)